MNRRADAEKEAVEMALRVRDRQIEAARCHLWGGDRIPHQRVQRLKNHAIHLLERNGVIRRTDMPDRFQPGCRCGGCRQKRWRVDRDRLEDFLQRAGACA